MVVPVVIHFLTAATRTIYYSRNFVFFLSRQNGTMLTGFRRMRQKHVGVGPSSPKFSNYLGYISGHCCFAPRRPGKLDKFRKVNDQMAQCRPEALEKKNIISGFPNCHHVVGVPGIYCLLSLKHPRASSAGGPSARPSGAGRSHLPRRAQVASLSLRSWPGQVSRARSRTRIYPRTPLPLYGCCLPAGRLVGL